jgi:hypothetical protein
MANQVNDADFGVIKAPGSYVQTKVIDNQAGTLSTGVIALIGEADSGPDFTQETSLVDDCSFGPDAFASVQQKYGSGPLVDAFFRAAQASNDPLIPNSFTRAILVKTNPSTRGTLDLERAGLTDFATVSSKNLGASENQVSVLVATEEEVAPTTGLFSYVPAHQQVIVSARVNGGAKVNLTLAANTGPATAVGTLESSAGASFNTISSKLYATGGVNRNVIAGGSIGATIGLVATGNSVVISLATGSWAVTPSVGDTLVIPNNNDYGIAIAANSVIAGGSGQNRGSYIVTAATSNSVTATKVRDYGAATVTAPVNDSGPIADVDEIVCFSPVELKVVDGVDRNVLSGLVAVTVAGTASGQNLTLTLGTGSVWAAMPQAGDLVILPASAPAAWRASAVNTGIYQVVSATSGTGVGASTLTMTRLSNGAPTSFSATAIAATTDLVVLKPEVDGLGKSLELSDGGGTEALATTPLKFMALVPNTNVSWISTTLAPVLLTSATEASTTLTASKSSTNTSEVVQFGGDIMMAVGYKGAGLATTGSLTISGTTLTTTVVGGNGQNLTVDLKQFATIGDLVSYLNAQPGYVAAAADNAVALKPLLFKKKDGTKITVLDKGTFTIASELGSKPGRIKNDGYATWLEMQDLSLLMLGTSTTVETIPSAGMPEAQALSFLSGGAKGSTTNANVQAALAALERVRVNFVVPLFSRDATLDFAQGLTESGSTYTIAQIHDLTKSHAVAMSAIKRRKWRQAFLSVKGSFNEAKAAARNVVSFRAAMTFQDVKGTNSQGEAAQFQPWMAAVLAASMQAGGFNEPIVKKLVNVSGVLLDDNSYGDSISDQEEALDSGLLPLELAEGAGFRFLSDQTTYGPVDSNFVYNSVQAVYMMDVLAALIADRMERKFVGRPLSAVPAGVIRSFLEAVMREALLLKITAPSDGAEQGFKDASVVIRAPAAYVTVTASLGTGLYYVLNTAFITKVEQSA